MSDLGGSLERWLAWVNKTPLRAFLLLILPVLAFVFGLGTWSNFWSGAAMGEAVDVGLTVPAFVFTVSVLVFAATRCSWRSAFP